MTFHLESIEWDQEEVLRHVGHLADRYGFYLGGGTAVALHFGHRRSVDFDWFTGERMTDPMQWAQIMRDEDVPFVTGQVAPGTLHGTVLGVHVSFLEYRYPLLQPLVTWSRFGFSLAGPDDLACMKLSAVAQRGEKRDFLDLYALVRKHRPLRELIDLYRRKYHVDDVAHLFYALVYFEDADRDRMPALLWDLDWEDVKHELRNWVKDVTE